MLAARFGDELAAPVVERIVYSGQGNPLALVEIARDLTPEQRRAEAPLDGSLPPSAEWAYLRRIEALPPDTRRALLLAALAGRGKRETVARACGIVGLDPTALDPAERVGLIEQDATRVTFCHELARTAVSYSALSAERRLAHGALADAVEGERRLWHQANAASGRDDAVADGLESVATRARDRSALCGRGTCVRAGRAPDLRSRPARGAAARVPRSPGTWRATCTRRSTISVPRWSARPRRRCGSSCNTPAAGSRRAAATPRVRGTGSRRPLRAASTTSRPRRPRSSPTPCFRR